MLSSTGSKMKEYSEMEESKERIEGKLRHEIQSVE